MVTEASLLQPAAFRLSNDGAVLGITFQGGVAVSVYSTRSFEELGLVETGIKGMYGVAFSPDGSFLAAASADGKVRIWEVPG